MEIKAGELLEQINYPSDLRKLKKRDLELLCQELRQYIIDVVSVNGGHFGASLGVVELTVALHYVFNTPYDQLVWDVAHTFTQYPYNIEEQKKVIIELLQINRQMDFSQVVKNSESRVHFVFNFLALLEMLQQQLISMRIGLGYNNFRISLKEESVAK